ncbi:ribonuclease VapC [Deinococcus aetherius]|uniref:Ribonuclease VapC n=1 Tax=Deinococcus aetherius TaxID=200252 RepID=A0ABM8ACP7_9DEIO|nr:type II toxin-antitoxin system VapC family toxin [Deinococcus aetherius]BDP41386.1 ribonuclease VapC [Deinococcus aetherius]
MAYLLDTNVISETARARPQPALVQLLTTTPLSDLYLSAVTFGEVEYGVQKQTDPARRLQLRAWVDDVLLPDYEGRILPVTGDVMVTWAQLVLRSGKTPGQLPRMDSLLAATALHHRLTLVTRNAADFQALGVPFLNPWEG